MRSFKLLKRKQPILPAIQVLSTVSFIISYVDFVIQPVVVLGFQFKKWLELR